MLYLVDYHHMCLVFSSFLKESAAVYTVSKCCRWLKCSCASTGNSHRYIWDSVSELNPNNVNPTLAFTFRYLEWSHHPECLAGRWGWLTGQCQTPPDQCQISNVAAAEAAAMPQEHPYISTDNSQQRPWHRGWDFTNQPPVELPNWPARQERPWNAF